MAFYQLGSTRRSAEQSGFFRWFQLEPIAADSTDRAAHYRPSGPAFRPLAELVLVSDIANQLVMLELRLARAFVDHPGNGIFARDIAKSMLRDALEGVQARGVADLANEIEFPRESAVPVITARRVEAALPEAPTAGYQVFLGHRGRFDQELGGLDLVLENYERDGTPWLRVALTAG